MQGIVAKRWPWLLAGMRGGMEFPGGSTAMGCDQLLDNEGYMAIVADEACNFFPRKFATTGVVGCDNFKPELLLGFRTGAAPERRLMKNKKRKPLEHSQVAMAFLSQFPAAREFIVEIVKHFSNGWAQGFLFTFSADLELLWEHEADDSACKDFWAELIEIVARAYGPRADIASLGRIRLAPAADTAYGRVRNMVERNKKDRAAYADVLRQNFSKLGYWGPSYTFVAHALREALKYAKFRRSPEWRTAEPEYTPQGPPRAASIPNLLSPSYTTGEWSSLSVASVQHAAHFLVVLQLGVQVLASEAGRLPMPLGPEQSWPTSPSTDQERLRAIFHLCRGRVFDLSDLRRRPGGAEVYKVQ